MFPAIYIGALLRGIFRTSRILSVCLVLACITVLHAGVYDATMKIRASSPGGAFVKGEPLSFQLVNNTPPPETYQVKNWRGKIVTEGKWNNTNPLQLPELPYGHYQLTTPAGNVSFAVLPNQVERHVSRTQFLAVDTHISWTKAGNKQAGFSEDAGYELIGELVHRLGVPILRDRISWNRTNPAPGKYDFSEYEKPLKPVTKRGIEVLSVYHDSPDWANGNRKVAKNRTLPLDFFALYEYNKKLAKQYQGKIQYWEFWNEQDIGSFSNAPAWEYAANLKAAYLGFKAGDPTVTVLSGPSLLYPHLFMGTALQSDLNCYFDIFSYHCYESEQGLEEFIRFLRYTLEKNGVSASTPIWLSEFNDHALGHAVEGPGLRPGYKEHSYRQELMISQLLVKRTAMFQQLGVARGFFFNLMPVIERNGTASWGLLRRDYTIKAGFTALANLTYQLGNAKLLGSINLGKKLHAFLYEQPDKKQSLLIWSDQKQIVKIPGMQKNSRVVDLFGTPVVRKDNQFSVDSNPLYFHGLAGLKPDQAAIPPGKIAEAKNPGNMDKEIVSRIILPKKLQLSFFKDSVDILDETIDFSVELYNFSTQKKKGKLAISGVKILEDIPEITLSPRSRKLIKLKAAVQPANGFRDKIVVGGSFEGKCISRLVVPFTRNNLLLKQGRFLALTSSSRATNWQEHSSGKMSIEDFPAEKAVRFTVDYPAGTADRWIYPQYRLQLPRESLKKAAGIVYEIRLAEPEPGGRYIPTRVHLRSANGYQGMRTNGHHNEKWQTEVFTFSESFDKGNAEILEIGFNPPRNHFSFLIRNIRIFYLD